MTTITDIALTWSEPVTLEKDELWQARCGTIFVSTTQNPGPKDGIAVRSGYVLPVSGGTTVRYRKKRKETPYIVREAT